MVRARIIGTGSYLPENVITNTELSEFIDTNDEWIQQRSGIKERHIAFDNQVTSDLGAEACKKALDMAGIKPEQVDVIICGTVSPDMAFPATAAHIQRKIGAVNACSFDITAACSGFVFGCSIADGYLRSGMGKYILVVGTEVLSRYLDWNDRASCVLFGDGAGAVLLTKSETDHGFLGFNIRTEAEKWDLITCLGRGTMYPPSHKNIDEKMHLIQLQGNIVFKLAVRTLAKVSFDLLDALDLTLEDIDLVIPHQANQRIIDGLIKKMRIPDGKAYSNIACCANTSSGTIPIALDECVRRETIKEGDMLLVNTFGAGLTSGAAVFRW